MSDFAHIEQEGRDARSIGQPAIECPYSFIKTAFWPKDYLGFDREMRPKLNAWMKGWIEENEKRRVANSK